MQLMSIAAQVPYTLKSEREADGTPKEGATVFVLRCLSATESGALEDALVAFSGTTMNGVDEDGNPKIDMGGMQISMSGRVINRVRIGLCGWENLTDENGDEVDYSKEKFQIGGRRLDGVPLSIIDRFGMAVIKELSDKIESLSTLSHEQGNA